MTDNEKKKAFDAAVKAVLKAKTAIQKDTHAEIVRLLKVAQSQISLTLASQPSQYQRWALTDLQFEITRALNEFGEASAVVIGSAAGKAWQDGQDLIDKPLQASQGGNVVATLQRIDTLQLNAMRAFMTDRIKDIGVQAANKINSELGLVVIGAQSPGDAITRVKDILGDPSRQRAKRIVVTELGRVFSVASHARMKQAVENGANLRKKWVKSGKQHPRINHNMAHGQIVPVDQPFLIPAKAGGVAIKMMHPHDPGAPASETINCGCTSVPTSSGFEGAGFVSKVQNPNGDAWTKQQLRDQAAQYRAKIKKN